MAETAGKLTTAARERSGHGGIETDMLTLGIILIIVQCVFLLQAAILVGASFGGFLGGTWMIVSAVVAILLWIAFAALMVNSIRLSAGILRGRTDRLTEALTWANSLFLTCALLSAGTGILLAFGAFASCGPTWLSGLYHWYGFVGSVLAFLAFFLIRLIANACLGSGTVANLRWWVPLVSALPVYVLWGLAWLIGWILLSGSIDESTYPDRSKSPYKLPFPGGESSWVVQGNNSSLNHNGKQEHSWDFRRPCGTPVLAARAGKVSKVVDKNDGNGGDKPNNMIEVDQGDGTTGRYLHIEKGSAAVKVGDAVAQGAQLARVGNVGNSMTGHVHFVVERGGQSIAVTFVDVTDDKGIPRTFSSYTSKNAKVK